MPSAASDLNDRLARLVAEHTTVPRPVLEHVFGSGARGIVAKLSQPSPPGFKPVPPLLKIRDGKNALPGGFAYVQPTPACCRKFGVSEKRSEPRSTRALNLDVGLSWFCWMGPRRRPLLNRKTDLVPHLGEKDSPRENIPHVLVSSGEVGHYAILRVYQAVNDEPAPCVKHLERLVADLNRKPKLAELIARKEYGLAILCPTAQSLKVLRKAILAAQLNILTVCDLGPTAETFATAYAAWRKKPRTDSTDDSRGED